MYSEIVFFADLTNLTLHVVAVLVILFKSTHFCLMHSLHHFHPHTILIFT